MLYTNQQKTFVYTILRSRKRKSITIYVRADKVEVRAPQFLTIKEIKNFVESKQNWILKKLQTNKTNGLPAKHNFVSDEIFLIKGKEYILKILSPSTFKDSPADSLPTIMQNLLPKKSMLFDKYLLLYVKQNSEQNVKKHLEVFYKEMAFDFFKERVQELAPLLGKKFPTKLQVRKYKSRWGSCNGKGEISLNFFLLMASPMLIDYVIIHELSHLYQMNHSPLFWKKVQQADPNYKEHRKILKETGGKFSF